jgi:DNA-binding NarL/FixJ family response regulator
MRVLIADERPSIRAALRAVLEHDPFYGGIDEAIDADGALAALGFGAGLLIIEWGLPGCRPAELLADIREGRPGLVIIVLGRYGGARRAALAAGADCYIDTSEPQEDFTGLLHHLCPGAVAALNRQAREPV